MERNKYVNMLIENMLKVFALVELILPPLASLVTQIPVQIHKLNVSLPQPRWLYAVPELLAI